MRFQGGGGAKFTEGGPPPPLVKPWYDNMPMLACRSPTPDLMSDDMRMDWERRRWEEQAEAETGAWLEEEEGAEGEVCATEPVHYQSVR